VPTAPEGNSLSESATITHPFHPLRGQSFPVLKARRVGGIDTLILRGTGRGTFAVPRAWTDRADPSPLAVLGLQAPILDPHCLLALRQLLQQLTLSGGLDS
jgi:Family of unknown function (DUF5372)